jgi:hypothetical protein
MIPYNAIEGTMFTVDTPDGKVITLQVPTGAKGGDTIHYSY